jgi:tetratricopeptide (TPR) repeat protein
MPFDAGREPRAWWLGEGTSVLLAEDLQALGVDAISRDERLRAFARLQVPAAPTLSHGTIIRAGQLVGAAAVVIGSLELEGDTLTLRARSLRLDTGRLQQEIREQGPLTDLFAIHDRVARRLAPAGTAKLPDSARVENALPAFENYIKGLLAETPASQVQFLEKAIVLNPEYDRARLALWRAHMDAGDYDLALKAATVVPDASALARRAQFAAALSEIELKRNDEAYMRLRGLNDRAPSAEVMNNIGVVQLRRGGTPETGRATYWFTKAAQANPTAADYCFNLGYAYWFDQDVNAAIYWLREAVRRNPADADAHFVLSAALQTSGSQAESARELELARRLSARWEEQAERRGPDRVPHGMERLARNLEAPAARAETALGATEQRDQRELAAFHLERGRRLFEKENDREAVTELRRALYLSPYLAEAQLLLGRIHLRGGRTKDAIDTLKIALWSEETAAAHETLAQAYVQAKDFEAARREAERALAMNPTARDAREVLDRLPPR